jgi:hypothetical protein
VAFTKSIEIRPLRLLSQDSVPELFVSGRVLGNCKAYTEREVRCVPREYSIVRTGSGSMGAVPCSLAWLYAARYWNQAGKGEKPRPPATSAYDSKPRK